MFLVCWSYAGTAELDIRLRRQSEILPVYFGIIYTNCRVLHKLQTLSSLVSLSPVGAKDMMECRIYSSTQLLPSFKGKHRPQAPVMISYSYSDY